MNQAEETEFAITADAIVAEPKNSRMFLEHNTLDVSGSVKEVFMKALAGNDDRPNDDILEEVIENLRVNGQPDAKAAGNILAWARNNATHRLQPTP
jgi:hypothetical protein